METTKISNTDAPQQQSNTSSVLVRTEPRCPISVEDLDRYLDAQIDSSRLVSLQELSRDIANTSDELDKKIGKLPKEDVDRAIEKNWLGIAKASSIQEQIKNVYKDAITGIGDCVSAIKSTNRSLGLTLDLIKVLARVERDIYEATDRGVIRNNEIVESLATWMKQQGINDKQVQELLDSSFQRAYTLRDRMNSLKLELQEKDDELDAKLRIVQNKQGNIDAEIQEKLQRVTEQTNELVSQTIAAIEQSKAEISAYISDTFKGIKELNEQTTAQVENAEREFTEFIVEQKKEREAYTRKVKDELSQQLAAQQKNLEQMQEAIRKSNKRTVMWSVIASTATAAVLASALCFLM